MENCSLMMTGSYQWGPLVIENGFGNNHQAKKSHRENTMARSVYRK